MTSMTNDLIAMDTGFNGLRISKQIPISSVSVTAIHRPHGIILVRDLYPSSGKQAEKNGMTGAFAWRRICGSAVDEFETD